MKRCSDRIYLASTLDPTPERREASQAMRATVAGLALTLFIAGILAAALLVLVR